MQVKEIRKGVAPAAAPAAATRKPGQKEGVPTSRGKEPKVCLLLRLHAGWHDPEPDSQPWHETRCWAGCCSCMQVGLVVHV